MQMASVKIGVDTDYAVRVRAQKAACCSAAAALLLLLCSPSARCVLPPHVLFAAVDGLKLMACAVL